MKRRTRHAVWGATLLCGLSSTVSAQFTGQSYPQTGAPPYVVQGTYPVAGASNPSPHPVPQYAPPIYFAANQPAPGSYLTPAPMPAQVPVPATGSYLNSPPGTALPSGVPYGASAPVDGHMHGPNMVAGPSWPQVQSLDQMAGPGTAGLGTNCGPGGCAPGNLAAAGAGGDWCQAGAGPRGMYFQLDLLTWAVSRPDVVAIGDVGSEGMVTVGGNTYNRTNSLDTGFITGNWTLGGRAEFGRIQDTRGWAGSVLFYRHRDSIDASGVWFVPADPDGLMMGYQDSNGDNIDDDLNMNRIHGRSGEDLGTEDAANPGTFIAPFDGQPDQGAPIDAGDMVNWLITFSQLTATNSVQLTGFELSDVYRPGGYCENTWDWFWGVRYLEFREQFGVTASGGTLDSSHWRVDSDNDLIGPQVGARWAVNRQWFRFTAEGRFLAALNFQNNRLNGNLASNAMVGGVNAPVALEPLSFNSIQTDTEFSPMGEWRMEASYYANDWLAFRLGYTGMVIGGISRASQKVSYTLPNFALSDAGSQETVLVNGLNIGFEINR